MDNVSQQTLSDKIAAQVEMRRAGRRKRVHHGGALCSKCLVQQPISGNRYCRECHNAASRASYQRKKGMVRRTSFGLTDGPAIVPTECARSESSPSTLGSADEQNCVLDAQDCYASAQ